MSKKIPQEYLDFIEREFTKNEQLKGYFLLFKEALKKRNAQDEELNKDKKNETKKLTPSQAGLFCEALLNFHNCPYTNKKKTIAPLASRLFGWAVSTIERNGFAYMSEDRKYIAELFESADPDFSSFVKNYGNKQHETEKSDSKQMEK